MLALPILLGSAPAYTPVGAHTSRPWGFYAMTRDSMQKLRLDRRLIRRAGWLSASELNSEIDALPDTGHKATTLGAVEDEERGDVAPGTESSASR